ncbi:MAG TPA: hypothetical protein DCM14_02175 [Clostridiales bacterium UBA8153]|nr:hypothetical protein [Clostridiales bacterium UBA8153]
MKPRLTGGDVPVRLVARVFGWEGQAVGGLVGHVLLMGGAPTGKREREQHIVGYPQASLAGVHRAHIAEAPVHILDDHPDLLDQPGRGMTSRTPFSTTFNRASPLGAGPPDMAQVRPTLPGNSGVRPIASAARLASA